MKISIVIPAYNEEHYLGRCLESICKLEEKPYEVIVVNNRSTDKTSEIALSYKVKVVTEEKRGITFARNKGFNTAQGDIIARTDADSIIPKEWLTKIIKQFENNDDIAGICGPTVFYDFPLFGQSALPTKIYLFLSKFIFKTNIMIGANMIISKKAWNKVKDEICINDKDIHEDIDISIHLKNHGKIIYDPNMIVYQSGRRIKNNVFSFFILYPIKYLKTFIQNKRTL